MASLHDILFPIVPRHFPHGRGVGIAFRTAHLLASGLLLGGHAFYATPPELVPLLYLVTASGAGLILIELYRSCDWISQGMGILVILKTGLTILAGLWWSQRVWILFAVVILGSVGSHMPAHYRHYSFRHGRVLDAKSSPTQPSSSLLPHA